MRPAFIALLPILLALTACGHKSVTPTVQRQAPAIARVKTGGPQEPVRIWQAHSGSVLAVVFSPDGSRLATSGDQGGIREWSGYDGRQLPTPALGDEAAYLKSVRVLASGGLSGVFTDTALNLSRSDILLAPPPQGGTQYVLLHGKKVGIYTIGPNGALRLVRPLPFITASPGNTPELALSPDGKMITLVAYRKVQVQEDDQKFERNQPVADLRDTATGRRLKVFGPPADYSRTFSPDGRTLATWSFDSGDGSDRLRFWNVRTGQVKDVAKPHGNDLICAAFSPDGQTLATGNSNGDVSLWRVPQW